MKTELSSFSLRERVEAEASVATLFDFILLQIRERTRQERQALNLIPRKQIASSWYVVVIVVV